MRYANPVLYGDYSDPDVIRAGDRFYLISSSFNYMPGIPVLRSGDLTHWETAGYAAARLPFPRYDRPQHKKGLWAPSIRFANGRFYVYVCMPDEGLFAYTAEDPAGPWECTWVKDVSGWIDPCPLFDDDGQAYLLHGFAASRCGINNILYLHRMRPDGLEILDKGRLVYNGADHGDVTVEGPKIYRRGGWYYILCPAGGVKTGYQLALRSGSPWGPYERRVVLAQGDTPVNGPHQGGWVEDGHGGDWFVHFQDVGPYGRIPHLQPVAWEDGWPVIGDRGEPVPGGETPFPDSGERIVMTDRFQTALNRQWQWQANPQPERAGIVPGGLLLTAAPAAALGGDPAFLSQLMQARDFDMTVRLRVPEDFRARAGIAMLGGGWRGLALTGEAALLFRGSLTERHRLEDDLCEESDVCRLPRQGTEAELTLKVRDGRCAFFLNGEAAGGWEPFTGDGWTSARPGIFCYAPAGGAGEKALFRSCVFTDPEGREI